MSTTRKVYDSWNDGSDVFKNNRGYYITEWNANKNEEYKKYLPKKWKPTPATEEELKAIRKRARNRKTRKTRKTRKHKRV